MTYFFPCFQSQCIRSQEQSWNACILRRTGCCCLNVLFIDTSIPTKALPKEHNLPMMLYPFILVLDAGDGGVKGPPRENLVTPWRPRSRAAAGRLDLPGPAHPSGDAKESQSESM